MSKQNILDSLGIDAETMDKVKDILPTFNTKDLKEGDKVFMTLLDDFPKKLIVNNKFRKKGEDATIETRAISAYVEKIERLGGDGLPFTIDIAEKNTVWLTSGTLSMGIARVAQDQGFETLKDLKLKITIATAQFKQGENRCYRVEPQ